LNALSSRIAHTDFLAGGISAGLLLLLVTVTGTVPWIAILLAVATYIGIVLMRPASEPAVDKSALEQKLAFQSAVLHLASIRDLQSHVLKQDVHDQIQRIAGRISQVLEVMDQDAMFVAAVPFNERLLEPFQVLLAEYVRLSARDVKSAEQLLQKAEAHDLPLIERAVENFYEKLNRGTVIDLATHAEMLSLDIESLDGHSQWRSRP
jgi:hypothetical protein